MPCSFPERHGRIRTFEKQVLFDPYEEPISRPDDDRRLDVQIPPCDLYSNLADLLPDRLPYLLSVAGLSENGGILPLANRDSRRKEGRKQGSRKDPPPVVVHLVSESCRSFTIVSFNAAEGQRTTVGENYPTPNSLQRFLTISNVRIIYSHKRATCWNQNVLARNRVIYVFPNQSTDEARQIGVEP
jgi:hypothetical protein